MSDLADHYILDKIISRNSLMVFYKMSTLCQYELFPVLLGLSAPVPRGRKGKKSRDQEVHFDANEEIEKAGIKMDREIVYNKNAYKRHIHRHSNK